MPSVPQRLPDEPRDAPPVHRDTVLAARLARGEHAAIDEFLAGSLDLLSEFVHWRVGTDRARGEDLVQSTLATALERIEDYDGRSSLATWMCGIARNLLRADQRKRRPQLLEDVLADADREIDAILQDVSREELPDHVLEREETRALVGATLSSLPADYRAALLAKYVDGKSTAQIAEASGKSAKAAESLLTRARVAFARVFELLAEKRGGAS